MKKIDVGGDFIEVDDNTDELSFLKGYRTGIDWARKHWKRKSK